MRSTLFSILIALLFAVNSLNARSTDSTDLLSRYSEPLHKPGLFTQWIRSLGLSSSATKQGNGAYRKQNYDVALQKYAEAALDNPGSQQLAYNIGNGEFRKKRYEDAIRSFTKALQGPDASLSAKTHYNLGNAYFRKGEALLQTGKQEGISDYREALAHYKKSLEVDPGNKDAKRNTEVVQARLKELLEKQDKQQQQSGDNKQKPPEPSARAKEALARALHLTQQRKYSEAMQVLQTILAEDATAASYKSHLQRLDDLTKILKGEQPSSPAPQDPRSQQSGMGVI